MAFYTNPGWSNLTPPPVSEQNLNNMSNALEKTVYIENGKLYDNDNNLIDVGNAKITLGSYVGNGSSTINIQIPQNQLFFIMLSGAESEQGLSTFPVLHPENITYEMGFVDQLYMCESVNILVYYPNRYSLLTRRGSAQDGNLTYESSSSGSSLAPIFNYTSVTYHYATIGV